MYLIYNFAATYSNRENRNGNENFLFVVIVGRGVAVASIRFCLRQHILQYNLFLQFDSGGNEGRRKICRQYIGAFSGRI